MADTYSTYDAKARFSEILRLVREGKTVTISYHGEAVAEIRPIGPRRGGVAGRLDDLEARGVLVRGERPPRDLRVVARKPGALGRVLRDRDE